MTFNREALRALAEDDIGRILTLRLNGQAIAFDYYFLICKRMYRYRHGQIPPTRVTGWAFSTDWSQSSEQVKRERP